jgi:hypothetical protein
VEQAFGRFQRSDRRLHLTAKLKTFLDDARRSELVIAVIVDGSYATACEEPNDIDLIIVLKPDVVWDSLRPFEYNAISKRMIRKMYRFDAYAYPETNPKYREFLDLFQEVNADKRRVETSRTRKGLLRIQL